MDPGAIRVKGTVSSNREVYFSVEKLNQYFLENLFFRYLKQICMFLWKTLTFLKGASAVIKEFLKTASTPHINRLSKATGYFMKTSVEKSQPSAGFGNLILYKNHSREFGKSCVGKSGRSESLNQW